MARRKYANRRLVMNYWIIDVVEWTAMGPMSFKKACKIREDWIFIHGNPVIIAKMVIDPDGKEVK